MNEGNHKIVEKNVKLYQGAVENYLAFAFNDQVNVNSDTISPDWLVPVDRSSIITPSPPSFAFEIMSEI